MQKLILATVDGWEKDSAIQAAWIARTLNVRGELPVRGTSIMYQPGSSIGREVGVQIPWLCERIENPRLDVRDLPSPIDFIREELPCIITLTNADTLILGVSLIFFCGARIVFEGHPGWMKDEPLIGGSIAVYALVEKRVRYGNSLEGTLRAWRNF